MFCSSSIEILLPFETDGADFCRRNVNQALLQDSEWVYHKASLHAYRLSPRHILSVPAEQLMRGDELGLAVTVPCFVAGLAAADDLGQLGSGGFVELLGRL
jgi:hypothetical protein